MRRPLAWLILVEVVVVAALAATTYHLLTTRAGAPAAAVAPATTHTTAPKKPKLAPVPSPPKAAAAATPHPLGPPPGLNFDPAFWSGQLDRINQDQHALEQLQWRLTSAVTDWLRAYVNQVLIPAVEHAENH